MPVRTATIAIAGRGLTSAEAAAAASSLHADLLLLPRPPSTVPDASDGSLAHDMGDLAEAHAVPICFAYRESCSGQMHQSLQLVQADGRATANYRSTHLGRSAIDAGLVPGNWLTTAHLESETRDAPLVLGLLAGIDHLAPEVARALSALGAQLLIAVFDHDEECAADLLGPLARLRAIENGVPVLLVDPSGAVHAAAAGGGPAAVVEQAGILAVKLDIDDQLQGNAEIGMPRRPDLYGQLTRGAPR